MDLEDIFNLVAYVRNREAASGGLRNSISSSGTDCGTIEVEADGFPRPEDDPMICTAETYYRTAYTHGEEAFLRGEPKESVGEHYNNGDPLVNPMAPLGVEGWLNGWKDAFCASIPERSYEEYQSGD